MQSPTNSEVRSHYSQTARRRSFAKGVGLFAVMGWSSIAGFLGVVLTTSLTAKLLLCFLYAVIFSVFFVVGHDACHGSLTPSVPLNRWLGRIALLPALHPATSWELGHNHFHHGWTNLKGMDYGYPPFSVEEFRALPRWRQSLERFYRTPLGIALFYAVEIWWKHLIWPRPSDFRKLNRTAYTFDLSVVILFLIFETWFAAWVGYRQNAWTGVGINVALAIAAPFAVWNWLMAFVTIQHHTHSRVAWFDSKEEWSFFSGQVEGTVHVRLPRWLEIFYHNILEHTAHHVDPGIPLYNLAQPQRALELAYPGSVIIQPTSLGQLSRTLRACKLYDYRRHCWLDFNGRPTGDPILVPKSGTCLREPATA
jgi:acyl-lipid omega-6 desaturase (Delta-12 desaturase)